MCVTFPTFKRLKARVVHELCLLDDFEPVLLVVIFLLHVAPVQEVVVVHHATAEVRLQRTRLIKFSVIFAGA